jgi:gliding motility-associated-like protein
MLKFLIGPAILLLSLLNAKADHFMAGDIQLLHVSGNIFTLRFQLYKDCESGSGGFHNDPIQMGIFDKGTNQVMDTVLMTTESTQPLSYGSLRCKPQKATCVEERIYRADIILDPSKYNSTAGYYISWERCCRQGLVDNILTSSQVGQTWYMEFTTAGIQAGNSSPRFFDKPLMFICYNKPIKISYNVQDANGDSLVFSLTTPLAGNTSSLNSNCDDPVCPPPQVLPGPYAPVTWAPGFGVNNMIKGQPTLSIDPVTGELSGKPIEVKAYVIAVKCEEFRNGVKIGEVRREQLLIVTTCTSNKVPVWVTPPTPANFTFSEIEAGEDLCIILQASDEDSADEVIINLASDIKSKKGVTFLTSSMQGGAGAELCLRNNCDYSRKSPYLLHFTAYDNGCPDQDSIFLEMFIKIRDPLKEFIEKIPNVFTPNDDGFNDHFEVNAVSSGCPRAFRLDIFNRWGVRAFSAETADFSWDGKDAAEGVYFYVITYAGLTYNGTLSLIR